MSLFTQRKQNVMAFYSEVDSYPVTLENQGTGISIINLGNVTYVFNVAGLNIPVPAGTTFDADLHAFNTISIVSGTGNFIIEVRGQS